MRFATTLLLFLSVAYVQPHKGRSVYSKNVIFKFYDEIGEIFRESTTSDFEDFQNHIRENPERFAIIVHGWRESCETKWVRELVKKLNEYRGGLIICMDYSYFSKEENYFRLVTHFDEITNELTVKLQDLEKTGYDPNNGYLFGFSFGGQLVIEAGRRFGYQKLKEIDACDIAGPGFDNKITTDHKAAAQNVQCIHTSRDKGTKFSLCHQDWKLGNCGNNQEAAGRPPFGSHGLCPYFYNSAFENPFYAVTRPRNCKSKNTAREWPTDFRMGYMENRKELVRGELFALTSKSFPYNVQGNGNRFVNFTGSDYPEVNFDYYDNY